MDWQATIADWLDREWVRAALPAAGCLALALIAWFGDRRRMRRSDPDAVGWVPWRGIGFWASFAALLLTAFALQRLLRG